MNKLAVIIIILLVILSQYYLLGDTLSLGFKPDDWILYFSYKLLGPDPLLQIGPVWAERGLYTTYQVYYMGLLDSLAGFDYRSFRQINLIFKILAGVSLYPLILAVFKRKLLAFLTVILFSISPSAAGPLEFAVKGSDYLAIAWMNLFLLVYYLIASGKLLGRRYYAALFLFFALALVFSPIRMFPLVVVPLLVETFFGRSLARLAVLFLPFVLLFFYFPISMSGNAAGPFIIFDQVAGGSRHLLLSPVSAVGYAFIPDDFWRKIFGLIMTDNFGNYLNSLLQGPAVVCGVLTALLTWSVISRQRFVFFILTMVFTLAVQVLFLFAASPLLPAASLPAAVFGGYVMVTGLMVFFYWLKWRDSKTQAIWAGWAFLAVFTWLTWLFAPLGTQFSGTSYYLVVASIGSSLMLSAFLVAVYDKLPFLLFLMLVLIFQMDSGAIRDRFSSLNREGRGAAGQIMMQRSARQVLGSYKEGDPMLVFFDTSEIRDNGPFYYEGFLSSFPFFMHFKENKIVNGCIGVVYEDSSMIILRNSVRVRGKQAGFFYQALCVDKGKAGYTDIFFPERFFHAFKIKDQELVDIKKSVLDRLDF